jgi:hypothetical protein
MHYLFIDFKKAYDSVRREALYNILIESDIPKKLLRLNKMCLTEYCGRFRVSKNLSEMFPITNGLKQGDALLPLLFNFALEYAIKRFNILGGSIHTVKESAEALLFATKESGLEVNADKPKCMVISRDRNAGGDDSVKIDNRSIERVEEFK